MLRQVATDPHLSIMKVAMSVRFLSNLFDQDGLRLWPIMVRNVIKLNNHFDLRLDYISNFDFCNIATISFHSIFYLVL